MDFPAQSAREITRLFVSRVLGPNKQTRGNGRQLRQQLPRFRQMIKKTAAKDRVESSERSQIAVLEVRLEKFHVANFEKLLDESRLAQIRFAPFQRYHSFHAWMLRENEALRAFARTEFQNCFCFRREAKKPLNSHVAHGANPAAVGLPIDLELVNPRTQLREFFGEILHRVDRALRRSMVISPATPGLRQHRATERAIHLVSDATFICPASFRGARL